MGRGILFFIVYRTRPVLSFRISGQHNITGSRGLCECDLLFSETNQPLMSHVSFLFSTSSSLCLFYLFSPPPFRRFHHLDPFSIAEGFREITSSCVFFSF
ncbi:hypothetical protein I7I48_08945 [Histoplasma ohiense]|nr:hypothetical protein I7I48_08945 [Histoplasma ohiense (nom. inval.)]